VNEWVIDCVDCQLNLSSCSTWRRWKRKVPRRNHNLRNTQQTNRCTLFTQLVFGWSDDFVVLIISQCLLFVPGLQQS